MEEEEALEPARHYFAVRQIFVPAQYSCCLPVAADSVQRTFFLFPQTGRQHLLSFPSEEHSACLRVEMMEAAFVLESRHPPKSLFVGSQAIQICCLGPLPPTFLALSLECGRGAWWLCQWPQPWSFLLFSFGGGADKSAFWLCSCQQESPEIHVANVDV